MHLYCSVTTVSKGIRNSFDVQPLFDKTRFKFGLHSQRVLVPYRTTKVWRLVDNARSIRSLHSSICTNVEIGKQDNDCAFNVLFFGSDDYSTRVLLKLIEHRTNNGLVKEERLINNIDVYHTGKSTESGGDLVNLVNKLVRKNSEYPIKTYTNDIYPMKKWTTFDESKKYDLAIVASFGLMIPDSMISSFPLGIVNFHPSLLPLYRGASPLMHAIMENRKVTGVSAIKLLPNVFDNGPIYMQRIVSNPSPSETTIDKLTKSCGDVAGEMAVEFLKKERDLKKNGVSSLQYWSSVWTVQDEEKKSAAPLIKQHHRVIDFTKDSAVTLEAKIRAFGPKRRLITSWREQSIHIVSARLPNNADEIVLRKLLTARKGNNNNDSEDNKTMFEDVGLGNGFFSLDRSVVYLLCAPHVVVEKLDDSEIVEKLKPNTIFNNKSYSILCLESIQIPLKPKPLKMIDLHNGYYSSQKTKFKIVNFGLSSS